MTADPYSALVRRLFAEPAHARHLDDAVVVRVDDQGVSVELSARPVGGDIAALGFRARGCPHVIAGAEAFCSAYEGRPISALDDFAASEIMRTLPVPAEKTGRILVLEDTVRALGSALRDAHSTKD
jgi:NifU-like protein involved in Fe-S cluster formation